MTIEDEVLALEEEGWQALKEGAGVDFYRRVLTENALMALPVGIMDRPTGLEAIESAPPWATYVIEEPEVLRLSDDSACVVYRARAQRPGEAEYFAIIASTYVRRGDAWQMILHQQTPLAPGVA